MVLEPSTKWSFNWHIEYVCNILQEEVERIIRGDKKQKILYSHYHLEVQNPL